MSIDLTKPEPLGIEPSPDLLWCRAPRWVRGEIVGLRSGVIVGRLTPENWVVKFAGDEYADFRDETMVAITDLVCSDSVRRAALDMPVMAHGAVSWTWGRRPTLAEQEEWLNLEPVPLMPGLITERDNAVIERDHAVARRAVSEAKLARVWEALEVEASERRWCEEYDDFARRLGGPGRERVMKVTVEGMTTLNVHQLDDVLGMHLHPVEPSAIDVRNPVDITHRATIRYTTRSTDDEISQGADDGLIEDQLEADGWEIFDWSVVDIEMAR